MLKMRILIYWLFFGILIVTVFTKGIFAQTTGQLISSSKADTWVATDALGREITTETHEGQIRQDKYVGIFYFIWQGAHGYDRHSQEQPGEGVMPKAVYDTISPYDNTQLLKANPTDPKYGPDHAFHYWGEPYFGYYLPDDEWVIRKHAQMLSDAGVDVIILDITNAAIYNPQVNKIASVYQQMRKEGKTTPAISFIINTAPEKTIQRLYDTVYKQKQFSDLWFYWKGKPLLLCPPKALTDETRNFFNVRQSWAWSKDQEWFADGKDKWPWLDHAPQSYGWHESPDKAEEVSVSLAQHPMSNIGRSFHNGKEPEIKQTGKGLYFEEQWKRALEVDPEFVFITGWNEWVAMRFTNGASKFFLGKSIEKGETYFVDCYNAEFSRDAEPAKDDTLQDNYYYQMVDNIRKFKGARSMPLFHKTNSINIDGSFKDWQNVEAVFADDQGDTFHRKHPGWGRIKEYVNTSGRNDIIESRLTSDKDHVFFYVKTAEPLTKNSENWMQLLIEIHADKSVDWEGFNFLVNRKSENNSLTTLEKRASNGKWDLVKNIDYKAGEKEIEFKIPKKLLGISGDNFTIDFKWQDNIPLDDNAMHWLDTGDTAPNARFKYRYTKAGL